MMAKKYLRGKWLALWILLTAIAVLMIVGYQYMRAQSFNEDPLFWEREVQKIEARYDGNYPQDVVVFIGSSSIRKWEMLAEDMAPIQALNHGFGGSKIKDSTYYLDRLVFPFTPRAVVLFAGTNDINGVEGAGKTGRQVYEGFVEFVETVRAEHPDLAVYYISISPTKARWKVWDDANEANQLIASYAETTENLTFIDTTEELLGTDGTPNKDLFAWDGLHLNEDGYTLWTSIIRPVLEKDLNQ